MVSKKGVKRRSLESIARAIVRRIVALHDLEQHEFCTNSLFAEVARVLCMSAERGQIKYFKNQWRDPSLPGIVKNLWEKEVMPLPDSDELDSDNGNRTPDTKSKSIDKGQPLVEESTPCLVSTSHSNANYVDFIPSDNDLPNDPTGGNEEEIQPITNETQFHKKVDPISYGGVEFMMNTQDNEVIISDTNKPEKMGVNARYPQVDNDEIKSSTQTTNELRLTGLISHDNDDTQQKRNGIDKGFAIKPNNISNNTCVIAEMPTKVLKMNVANRQKKVRPIRGGATNDLTNFLDELRDMIERDNTAWGDCLFKCCSNNLVGNESMHVEIRLRIVRAVIDNWEAKKDYLMATCEAVQYRNAAEYQNDMSKFGIVGTSKKGTYGTDFEVSIFMETYHVPVTIYRELPGSNIVKKLQTFENAESRNNPPLILLFRGDQLSGHWLEFIKKPESIHKPPCTQSIAPAQSSSKNKMCTPSIKYAAPEYEESVATEQELTKKNTSEWITVSRKRNNSDTKMRDKPSPHKSPNVREGSSVMRATNSRFKNDEGRGRQLKYRRGNASDKKSQEFYEKSLPTPIDIKKPDKSILSKNTTTVEASRCSPVDINRHPLINKECENEEGIADNLSRTEEIGSFVDEEKKKGTDTEGTKHSMKDCHGANDIDSKEAAVADVANELARQDSFVGSSISSAEEPVLRQREIECLPAKSSIPRTQNLHGDKLEGGLIRSTSKSDLLEKISDDQSLVRKSAEPNVSDSTVDLPALDNDVFLRQNSINFVESQEIHQEVVNFENNGSAMVMSDSTGESPFLCSPAAGGATNSSGQHSGTPDEFLPEHGDHVEKATEATNIFSTKKPALSPTSDASIGQKRLGSRNVIPCYKREVNGNSIFTFGSDDLNSTSSYDEAESDISTKCKKIMKKTRKTISRNSAWTLSSDTQDSEVDSNGDEIAKKEGRRNEGKGKRQVNRTASAVDVKLEKNKGSKGKKKLKTKTKYTFETSSLGDGQDSETDSSDEEECGKPEVNQKKRATGQKKMQSTDAKSSNGKKSKSSLERKKKIKYSENLGGFRISRAQLLTVDPQDPGKQTWCPTLIKVAYNEIMQNDLKCYCSLSPRASQRINKNTVVAYAKCGYRNHDQYYRFEIGNLHGLAVDMTISSDKKITFHHRSVKTTEDLILKQVRGEARVKLAHTLTRGSVREESRDLAMTHQNDIDDINDGKVFDLMKRTVAYKIVSEQNVKDRLTLSSAHMSDLMQYQSVQQTMPNRYLQRAGAPLFAEMYTKIALYFLRQEIVRILHLDGTAGICTEPQDFIGKLIMYYTIIFHHKDELVKLAEKITCEHDQCSIKSFLMYYRAFVEKSGVPGMAWPFADVIVTDWSWVNINSVMDAWNDTDTCGYSDVVHECCTTGKQLPKTLIAVYICYNHFMHLVPKSIKRNFPKYSTEQGKGYLKMIMEYVAQIALGREIGEIDLSIQYLWQLLLAKSERLANESIKNMNKLVKRRAKLVEDEANEVDSDSDLDAEVDRDKENTLYAKDPKVKTMYLKSKFYYRYLGKKNDVLDYLKKCNDGSKITNVYHDPELCDHFLRKWMPYIFFWSGLILALKGLNISRLSNAPVEASHKVVKEKVFKGRSTASIGDAVRRLEIDHQATIGTLNIPISLSGKKDKPYYPEYKPNPFLEDGFKRKKKKNKGLGYREGRRIAAKASGMKGDKNASESDEDDELQPSTKQMKYCGVDRKQSLPAIVKIERADEGYENVESSPRMSKLTDSFDQKAVTKFTTKTKRTADSSNETRQTKKRKLVELEPSVTEGVQEKSKLVEMDIDLVSDDQQEEFGTTDNLPAQIDVREESSQELTFYFNGVVLDPEYYWRSQSISVGVAIYKAKHTLAYKKINVTASNYATLRPGLRSKSWVEGDLLDSLLAAIADQAEDVTHVHVYDSSKIMGEDCNKRTEQQNKRDLLRMKPLRNRLLMAYTHNKHWYLVVIDKVKEIFYHLDPYERGDDETRALTEFLKFIALSDKKSEFYAWKGINWTIDKVPFRPYQHPKDVENCGVFMPLYAEHVVLDKPFPEELDLVKYRHELAKGILIMSDDVSQLCLYCLTPIGKKRTFECCECRRKCHHSCRYNTIVDSDDEKNKNKCKQAKAKAKRCVDFTEKFTCKLCLKRSKRIK